MLSSNFGILHSINVPSCEAKIKPFVQGMNLSSTVSTQRAVGRKFHLQHGTKKPLCSEECIGYCTMLSWPAQDSTWAGAPAFVKLDLGGMTELARTWRDD